MGSSSFSFSFSKTKLGFVTNPSCSGARNDARQSHSRSSPVSWVVKKEAEWALPASPAESSRLACAESTASKARVACRHPQLVCAGTAPLGSALANTASNNSNRHNSVSASPGDGPRSIPPTSFPTLSRLTFVRKFSCTVTSVAAVAMESSRANPNRDANRTALKMRNGSSRKVVRGGSGVRIKPP